MKQVMSISVSEYTISKIEEAVAASRYRSKSHLIELAIEKFLEEEG